MSLLRRFVEPFKRKTRVWLDTKTFRVGGPKLVLCDVESLGRSLAVPMRIKIQVISVTLSIAGNLRLSRSIGGRLPPKAEATGSNPVGRANDFNGLVGHVHEAILA